jgi:hypothetical protein
MEGRFTKVRSIKLPRKPAASGANGRKREATASVKHKSTKTARVIALLRKPAGATLQTIITLTGWQAHSVRAFLSAQVMHSKGFRIEVTERKGQRVYRIVS